jgi:hypothetical protein
MWVEALSLVVRCASVESTSGRRTHGLGGFFAGLFGALAAGYFGIRGERPIDFDSIALLQSVIRPNQCAENTERGIREIDADEIRVESGQAQGISYAGTRREA